MANRPSKKLPAPHWNAARLRGWLRDQGYGGDLPLVAWFGDNPEQVDQLAELVRRGRKRATASLLWRWEDTGCLPETGDHQVIIDWQGEPRAVIEMTEVRIVPFEMVDAGFARAEGEGNLSLDDWRELHWDFFARECKRLGRKPNGMMPVVCMRFRLVHPKST